MLNILASLLQNDDHMVVVVREDSYKVNVTKGDVGLCISLIDFEESRGYYICGQHKPVIFPAGGVTTSSASKTSSYGVNHKLWSFSGHLQVNMVRMTMMKVRHKLFYQYPTVPATVLVKK